MYIVVSESESRHITHTCQHNLAPSDRSGNGPRARVDIFDGQGMCKVQQTKKQIKSKEKKLSKEQAVI